jgi:HD-GYP domain-containing protein (c-di-GMP phosphodiesterase class II)
MPASLKARALIGGTLAAGAAIVAAASVVVVGAPIGMLALLGAAVVVAELLQVSGDDDSVERGDTHTVSFSSGVHLAAVLLVGPWAAALIAAFGVLAVDRLRGTAWRFILFNASAFPVATLFGGLAYRVAGGHPANLSLPGALPAILALVLAYSVANTLLVSAAVAFHTDRQLWPYFSDSIRRELQPKAAEASIAVTASALAIVEPWALVALIPLVFAVYQAHARLALLRRETSRALETFANVVDERDAYTYRHSERVAAHVAGLAEALHLPRDDAAGLRWAGRLHDLGKIAVDPAIINKPGALRDTEWAELLRHPRLSARLLRNFRLASEEARAVEYHHERFDGNGYYGVETGGVPLAAHFLIVADAFDAMTTDRPYRRGLSKERALAEIEEKAGSQFHPGVARAFVAHQRGEDPRATLSAAEQAEMRSVMERRPRARNRYAWPGTVEAAALTALVVALIALAFGFTLLAGLGAAGTAAALACRHRVLVRARKLAASLRTIARPRSRPDVLLQGIAARLVAEGDLRWAAFVRWNPQELTGSVELSWGHDMSAPRDAALMSWLVREADADKTLLQASGSELGGTGDTVAVMLRHGRERCTLLLLTFTSRVPRHVELALGELAGELQLALIAVPPTAASEPAAAAAS